MTSLLIVMHASCGESDGRVAVDEACAEFDRIFNSDAYRPGRNHIDPEVVVEFGSEFEDAARLLAETGHSELVDIGNTLLAGGPIGRALADLLRVCSDLGHPISIPEG